MLVRILVPFLLLSACCKVNDDVGSANLISAADEQYVQNAYANDRDIIQLAGAIAEHSSDSNIQYAAQVILSERQRMIDEILAISRGRFVLESLDAVGAEDRSPAVAALVALLQVDYQLHLVEAAGGSFTHIVSLADRSVRKTAAELTL